ncbi:hypothetical protein [Streptomyces sp. NPDC004286]|uniref:hypothetical protein n=1 Tax=Streptomyces sp. NPDC004286 TaxID=3364696 RepID=UPI003681E5B9
MIVPLDADWAAVHDQAAAEATGELVDGMRTDFGRTWTKPGRLVDAMAVRARRSPPTHLPWFWEAADPHRTRGNGAAPAGRAPGLRGPLTVGE